MEVDGVTIGTDGNAEPAMGTTFGQFNLIGTLRSGNTILVVDNSIIWVL